MKTRSLPKLSDAVGVALEAKRMNRKELAAALRLSYEALRHDLSRNKFAVDDLLAMCRILGLPDSLDDLRSKYDFQTKGRYRGVRRFPTDVVRTGLAAVFGELDSRMERVRRSLKSQSEIVKDFFSALHANDVFGIYITDVMPTHWTNDPALLSGVAEKLNNDALITYLHPVDEVVQGVSKTGYSALLTKEQVRSEFDRFKRALRSVPTSTPEKIEKNLILVPHDCAFLCTPLHRYVLYIYSAEQMRVVRATCTFPIRRHLEREVVTEKDVMDLSDEFAQVLQKSWTDTLQRYADCDIDPVEESARQAERKRRATIVQPFLDAALVVPK